MKKIFKNFIFCLMVVGLVFGSTALATAIEVNLVDGDWQNAQFDYAGTYFDINNSGTSGGLRDCKIITVTFMRHVL